MGWVMFSIVQDIAHIGQQGDCGLYFGPNSPQSPGDIVSFDFFSIANSFSWWYWKLVNCRKEHTKKHKYQKTQVPVIQVWKDLEIKNNRRQVRSSAGFGFPKSFELSVISHIQNMYVRSGLSGSGEFCTSRVHLGQVKQEWTRRPYKWTLHRKCRVE